MEKEVSFTVKYKYISNSGKRVAQSQAFYEYQDEADIFLTMDSDTVLDENAIYEGCVPFQDSEIMSVAGLLLSENRTTLISKMLGISFPVSFTNGRASASVYNAVSVSCGGLALYRNTVIKKFLDHYLNQIVFGQRAMFGDDRMLTHYASLLGKTIYQETAIGYTLMPENISHLTRQRVRWWKSFWWGECLLFVTIALSI
jgi:hyaluronan synthase